MKRVPYYPNHEDNKHCMLASYRMIISYLLRKELTWEQLEELTGFEDGRVAWTLKGILELHKMGLDIKMIEPFDYKRYSTKGVDYLKNLWPKEIYNWYIDNSNILDIKKYIPEFLQSINFEKRFASQKDIDDMLDEGRLVFVTLNSRLLNNKEGYVSHAVLIVDREENKYIVNDPGGPLGMGGGVRKISKAKIMLAMQGLNNEDTYETTGFKLNA